MKPSEKWERLNNPRTVEDYGLSLTESELRTFPDGREILLEIRLKQRMEKQVGTIMRKVGYAARQTIDRIAADVLQRI